MGEAIDMEPYAGTTKADLFARYQTVKAERDQLREDIKLLARVGRSELTEARTLVRELVEAGENVARWKDPIWAVAPELGGALTAIYRLEAALTKARASGYTEEGE